MVQNKLNQKVERTSFFWVMIVGIKGWLNIVGNWWQHELGEKEGIAVKTVGNYKQTDPKCYFQYLFIKKTAVNC